MGKKWMRQALTLFMALILTVSVCGAAEDAPASSVGEIDIISGEVAASIMEEDTTVEEIVNVEYRDAEIAESEIDEVAEVGEIEIISAEGVIPIGDTTATEEQREAIETEEKTADEDHDPSSTADDQNDTEAEPESDEFAPEEAPENDEDAASGNAQTNAFRINDVYIDPFPVKLSLGVKESFTLDATDALSGSGKVTYTSSNKKVATVNKKGVVKAKKKGTTKITAKQGNKKVVCKITVMKAPNKVTVSPTTMNLGVGIALPLTVTIPKKTASQFKFKSSDESVAVVDNVGRVYGMGIGTATITVQTFNKKKATCTVIVTESGGPEAIVTDFVIEDGIVTGYSGIGGTISVPSADGSGRKVTAIGNSVFKGNTSIVSVTIPASIIRIGDSAFEDCAELRNVTMSNDVTSIGKRAFKHCGKLETMNTF